MKLVYICSPYTGIGTSKTNRFRNIIDAQHYCDIAIKRHNVIPIAPHVYLTQFLCDDVPEQRELGLRMARELLTICQVVWVFGGDGISEGMAAEIELAEQIGIPVLYKNWACETV